MNINRKTIAICVLTFSLLLTSCGPGQLFGVTVTPTLTITSTPTFTPTATATQVPTQTSTPTLTPTPTQIGGGSGKIIFELRKDFMSETEKETITEAFPDLEGNQNVFTANIDGMNMVPITNGIEGYNYIQDISPDGTKLLISSSKGEFGNLYSIDLNSLESEPLKLAKNLPRYSWQGKAAEWIDNTRLVFVGEGDIGFGVYSVNSDGTDQRSIYKYNGGGDVNKPVEILAITDTRVYWASQVRTSLGGNSWNTKSYSWWSSMDGSGKEALELNGEQIIFDSYFFPPAFSPDGKWLAWMEPATQTFHYNRLHITSLPDMKRDRYVDMLTSGTTRRWWPDSSKIQIFDLRSIDFSHSYEMNTADDKFGLYSISLSSLSIKNEHRADVLDMLVPPASLDSEKYCSSAIGDFSPDGRQILIFSSKPNTECASKIIYILDLETMTFSELPLGFRTYRDRGYWLP